MIIGTAIYIATLDGNYNLKQIRIIKVPTEVVFNTVNDFKNWQYWAPWHEMDSTIVASIPGTTSGVGASYTWAGKEGNGSIKTISLIPHSKIIQQVNFGTGSTAEIYWNLEKINTETEVTWGVKGKNTFGKKFYWLIQGGIDKNMAPIYDRGLELLEQYLLKELEKHTIEIKGVVDYGGGFYLYQATSCNIKELEKKRGDMFASIIKYMGDNNIDSSGKPFTVNHKWDKKNNTAIFSACIPVKERVITTGDVSTGFLTPQKTFKTILKGDYKFLNDAWKTAHKTLTGEGFSAIEGNDPFEIYTVSPRDTENPAEWITEIYIPIK